MSSSSVTAYKHICLRDGRTLGYAEFGAPAGKPIFLFSGTTSRLFYPLENSVAMAAQARIITVERPGLGLSDFQPGRTLLDWPDDIAQLADALKIDQFAVAGGSAGGPYAAACAFKLPRRIPVLGLISSLAPFDTPEIARGMTLAYRLIPFFAQRLPWLFSLSQKFMLRNPENVWKEFYGRLPACDKAILQQHPDPDMKALLLRDLPEIMRQGTQGVVWDMRVLTGPWGFSPAAIKVKTYLWQGEQDVNVPRGMGQFLAATIPNCEARFIPNAGHLMYIQQWPTIVQTLAGKLA